MCLWYVSNFYVIYDNSHLQLRVRWNNVGCFKHHLAATSKDISCEYLRINFPLENIIVYLLWLLYSPQESSFTLITIVESKLAEMHGEWCVLRWFD